MCVLFTAWAHGRILQWARQGPGLRAVNAYRCPARERGRQKILEKMGKNGRHNGKLSSKHNINRESVRASAHQLRMWTMRTSRDDVPWIFPLVSLFSFFFSYLTPGHPCTSPPRFGRLTGVPCGAGSDWGQELLAVITRGKQWKNYVNNRDSWNVILRMEQYVLRLTGKFFSNVETSWREMEQRG